MGGRGATIAGAIARHVGDILAKGKRTAQEIGKRYHKNIAKFWRAHKGKKLGDWRVLAVEKKFAGKVAPDLVLVNEKTKQIFIHDATSKIRKAHLDKGKKYVKHIKKLYPGYKVAYHEGYWRTLERVFRLMDRAGRLRVPFSGR